MASGGKLRIELLEDRRVLNTGPLITEFMAANSSTLLDGDGASSDWIELYNPTAAPIDLTGWHLTDSRSDPTKWPFPAAELAPDEYLVVFASSPGVDDYVDAGGFFHASFALSAGGEYLALADPAGAIVQEYAPEFPPQTADVSYGLDDQRLGAYFSHATPGAANDFASAHGRRILVTEIMYHPASDNDLEEYIELYNGESVAVNLSGWSIAGAVDFELPEVVLNPESYLAIAADLASFRAKYGDAPNVVAGWQGKLANSGDSIMLRDDVGRPVDLVQYSDEGNWAQREEGPLDQGHRGWVWSDAHDGGGSSLELVGLELSNAWGQNWAASNAVDGTPGATNSVADQDADVAPLVLEVLHWPIVPRSTDAVVVTATLLDELTDGLSADLFWRIDGAAEFSSLAMVDDGSGDDARAADRRFTAALPLLPDGAVVEFYVQSSDLGENTRTFPAPTQPSGQQLTNLLLQVDDQFDPAMLPGPDDMPLYRLIMTETERAELEQIGSTRPDSFSHARMNGSFVSVSNQGVEVRYLTGIRNRGAGSSSRQPNSYHVDFPRDEPWQDKEAVNFNTQFTHLQLAGLRLFQLAGLVAEDSAVVRVLVNGADLTDDQAPSFGVYLQLEAADERFVASHFPEDAEGNLYRVIPDGGRRWGDLRDLGDDPSEYAPFYDKKTNAAEADYTDLIELVDVLNNASEAEYYARLNQVADVDQWLGYFAMNAIMANQETMLATGSGDDYLLYRGADDPRFVLIPHDMDTIFGQGNAPASPTSGIYGAAAIATLQRFLTHPQIAPAYHEKLRELLQTVFSKPVLDPFLDELLSDFAPADSIAEMKSFMDGRRQFIADLINAPLTAVASLPVKGGYYHSTDGRAVLHGTASLAGTRSVLVNGTAAEWDASSGQWSIGESTSGATASLISSGDSWRYLDAGRTPSTGLGEDWRVDDPNWSDAGPSQLGYGGSDGGGEGDEQTVVRFVDVDPDQSGVQKNITTYFRKTFQVVDASQFSALTLRILRDDGAVVYVNGQEAARPNMPDGPIEPDTEALSAVSGSEEDQFFEFSIDPGLLRDGENVVAVEIHQANRSSSDISFDLELTGVIGDPQTVSGVSLRPGVNRIRIEAFDGLGGTGRLMESTYMDVWYDDGVHTPLSGAISEDRTLTAAEGPYIVADDLTVVGGVLTIEPGVTMFFNPGAGLIVQGAGRIVAEGTAESRIRLAHNPNLGDGRWDGISLIDAPAESRFANVDMQSGDDAGQAVLVDHATALFDHSEWMNVDHQVLDLIHPSLEVLNSTIPAVAGDETVHLFGLDQGEWLVFDGNVFGFNSSGGDVVDLGHDTLAPPTIVFRNNVFMGGLDDGVDTDGFPVLIENNIFQNFHYGTSRTTTSNAVSTGHMTVGAQTIASDLALRGNIFFNNDHDLLLKDFSFADLEFNTMVGATVASIHFTEDNGSNVIGPGLGASIDGHIFWDAAAAFSDLPPNTQLTLNRSIVPSAFVPFGAGNIDADPLLLNPAGGDFRLGRESPGLGAGSGGADIGAVQTPRYEPASAANLKITELHYHPLSGDKSKLEIGAASPLFEFVELRNVSDRVVDLSGAAFVDGIELEFPWRRTLDPGQYGVVVNNEDVFRSRYGDEPTVLGEFAGRLANSGERLELVAASGERIARFAFDDDASWPQQADGAGHSLVVIDPAGDYDSPTNYVDSRAVGGSPGSAEPTSLPADFDSNAMADGHDLLIWQRGFGTASPNATHSDGDADGDRDVDQADEAIWEATFGQLAKFAAETPTADLLQGSASRAAPRGWATVSLARVRSPEVIDAAIVMALHEGVSRQRLTEIEASTTQPAGGSAVTAAYEPIGSSVVARRLAFQPPTRSTTPLWQSPSVQGPRTRSARVFVDLGAGSREAEADDDGALLIGFAADDRGHRQSSP